MGICTSLDSSGGASTNQFARGRHLSAEDRRQPENEERCCCEVADGRVTNSQQSRTRHMGVSSPIHTNTIHPKKIPEPFARMEHHGGVDNLMRDVHLNRV